MSRLVLRCWEHGHEIEVGVAPGQIEKFLVKCKKLKNVCPDCKPANKHLALVYNEYNSLFSYKAYQCRHGHLTLVSSYGESAHRLSVSWGPTHDDQENVDGMIDDLPELIDQKTIACHHIKGNGKQCGCKLKACDDASLSYPQFSNFKTKTRVEDVWRKYGVADPKVGSYDERTSDPRSNYKPKYNATEFEKRNKERLKRMQRSRNISIDRTPGTPIS